MLLRQLFDEDSYTYTYLIADQRTRHAALIDPVADKTDMYLNLLRELSLDLKLALDTHVHADHITGLGRLRDLTQCKTYLGNEGAINCADNHLSDQQVIPLGKLDINVIYTPGHTDDSYTFLVMDHDQYYAFTGDTLLIRGSGRTDFQNGDPTMLYDSLHEKLMTLPENTWVYPAHDYKGMTLSTIGEEKRHNPRILMRDKKVFTEFMNNLDLPDPKWMDIAVPANQSCGNK